MIVAQIFNDGFALGFVDQNAIKIVVAHVADEYSLLTDREKAAFHRSHLYIILHGNEWRH
jgi:hypothetical protein